MLPRCLEYAAKNEIKVKGNTKQEACKLAVLTLPLKPLVYVISDIHIRVCRLTMIIFFCLDLDSVLLLADGSGRVIVVTSASSNLGLGVVSCRSG